MRNENKKAIKTPPQERVKKNEPKIKVEEHRGEMKGRKISVSLR